MPYIKKEKRGQIPETAGELCYKIFAQCKEYLLLEGECFNTYAAIISALEMAKLEFYQRRIRPYEDKKMEENGDV